MRSIRARGLPAAAFAAATLCLLPGGAHSQQRNLDAYASRLAVYRSGDFRTALQASMAFSVGRLRDQAEEYFRQRTDVARDLDVLAAAMLHFDLAWAAEMEPEKNESIARDLLNRVSGTRRDAWIRDAHLGLLGVYVDRGRLDGAARMGKFLADRYPDFTEVRFARAHLAEFIGWGLHDERFMDQAQAGYEDLLLEGEGDPAALHLRIAHLTLRAGDPEDALKRLGMAGDNLSAVHRFVSLLLRGETLLWLARAAAAEAAFAEAQAVHLGSMSAAAGLAAARQTLGDGEGAAEAVRGFLSQSTGQDTWWRFLVQPLADEIVRLDRLRGLVLLPQD